MDLFDFFRFILIIFCLLVVGILLFVLFSEMTSKCLKYEDLCYHNECSTYPMIIGKVTMMQTQCMEKPVSCSANDVKGHKSFCTIKKYWYERR